MKRIVFVAIAGLTAVSLWLILGRPPTTPPRPPGPATGDSSQSSTPQALLSPPTQSAAAASAKSQTQKGQTVVTTSDKAAVEAYVAEHGLQIINSTALTGGQSLLTLAQPSEDPAIKQLAKSVPGTKVDKNYSVRPTFIPNDTYYLSDQWALPKISAPSAWDVYTGSSSTTIAVVDSGILFSQTINSTTYSHADFPDSKKWTNPGETGMTAPNDSCWTGVAVDKSTNGCDDDNNSLVDDWQGWDFMGGFRGNSGCPNFGSPATYQDPDDPQYILQDNEPQPYSCDNPFSETQLNKNDSNADTIGHGTAVASVAAAATNNAQFIAGLNINAKLMNLRIFDGYGNGYLSDIIAAVDYAAAKGANVINLSLAFNDCSSGFSISTLESALANAKASGIIIVGAAGNEGLTSPGSVCYPASSPNAVAAGASDVNDNRASWSNFGPELDVVAPGLSVLADNAPSAANSNASVNFFSGTSLSAPYVSGLAALLRGLAPAASADDIARFITAQADKVAGMGGANRTDNYGYGRINAWRSPKFAVVGHADGTLVKHPDSPAVYLVEDGQRRYVPQAQIFFSNWSHVDSRVKTITPIDLALSSAEDVGWQEGALLKGSGPEIYALELSGAIMQKRHITSPVAYQSLGYDDNDRINVPDSLLPAGSGADINFGSRHPQGTLVRQTGQLAVYLIDAGQKRYVPNPGVLQSLNKGNFKVFPATAADLALADGNLVTHDEGTLLRGSGSLAVYIIDNQSSVATKRHILSPEVFTMLGYSGSDIIDIPSEQLPASNGSAID